MTAGNQSAVLFRFEISGALFQTHRHAELRKAVRKVGRAVERIDVPAELALHSLARAFFAVDAVIRKNLAETGADELFHGPVGNRDQVDVALVLGFHSLGQKFAQALPPSRAISAAFGTQVRFCMGCLAGTAARRAFGTH